MNPSQQIAQRMARMATEVGRADQSATRTAGLQAKNAHLAVLRADTGDLRMSGVGSEPGAKVGAKYTVLKGAVVVQATGPVHLLERPSAPHLIIPKKTGRGAKGRGSKRENKQALYNALFGSQWAGVKPLRTPYGPRYRVQHPGVRNPKGSWSKGFARAKPLIDRTIKQAYGAAFSRAMRG